jgi:hypothetical protein
MDEQITQLISGFIHTERSRRSLPADKAMLAIRDEFTRRGALGHGRFPVLLDEASAREYESRAEAWLGVAGRVASELQIEWTTSGARSVRHQLQLELTKDWEEIFGRLERFAKASPGLRMELLDKAKWRVERHLEQEFALLVMKADRTRLPLIERLSADRYRSVAGAWRKAHALLDQPIPDLANAAKEAVGAVEALARIVTNDSNAKLGDAIKALRHTAKIRAPLLKGIEELWGWTSGEAGVRHAALEGPLELADVRYCFGLAEAALGLLLAADAT